MERLAGLPEHEVRDVHDVVDGPQADRRQPPPQPFRTGPTLTPRTTRAQNRGQPSGSSSITCAVRRPVERLPREPGVPRSGVSSATANSRAIPKWHMQSGRFEVTSTSRIGVVASLGSLRRQGRRRWALSRSAMRPPADRRSRRARRARIPSLSSPQPRTWRSRRSSLSNSGRMLGIPHWFIATRSIPCRRRTRSSDRGRSRSCRAPAGRPCRRPGSPSSRCPSRSGSPGRRRSGRLMSTSDDGSVNGKKLGRRRTPCRARTAWS